MKKPYDFLLSEKEPFQYIEKAKLVLKDGFLTALKGHEGPQIIAPSSLMFLLLGAGTSITQEAALFCARHDLFLCFARGGSNIHTIWQSHRYQNPVCLRNQIKKIDGNQLVYAKALLKYRFYLVDKFNKKIEEELDCLKSINEILLYEARFYKNLYKELAIKNKVDFTRNKDGTDYVNERLNILNNVLYSVTTALCLGTHISPSIAIIHGDTRRGGLTFDLADLIKIPLVYNLCFDKNPITTKDLMHKFSQNLKQNNQFYLKLLLNICLSLADNDDNLLTILKVPNL